VGSLLRVCQGLTDESHSLLGCVLFWMLDDERMPFQVLQNPLLAEFICWQQKSITAVLSLHFQESCDFPPWAHLIRVGPLMITFLPPLIIHFIFPAKIHRRIEWKVTKSSCVLPAPLPPHPHSLCRAPYDFTTV
jgi:hypothetical protein